MSTSLADASEERKARLLALRRRKAGESTGDEATAQPSLLLANRNYDPESRTLRKHAVNGADAEHEDTVEKAVAGVAEMIIREDEAKRAEELDVFNIAPKRPNWDLKRETDKKLAKLERRTQEAIHTLIRQRLAAQKGNSDDLVGAMQAQQEAAQASDDED